jgi:hypothetical protein
MRIDLSEREIELIIHLLTEQVSKVDDGQSKVNFSMDEVILLEKLEQSLKFRNIDIKGLNGKYLN